MYGVDFFCPMGVRVGVDFLRTTGGLTYDSPEQFVEGIRWRVGPLKAAEEKRLLDYFGSLPREADGRVNYRHDFEWALLSWDQTP